MGLKSRANYRTGFCEEKRSCGNADKKCDECSRIKGAYTHFYPIEWDMPGEEPHNPERPHD